MSASLKFVVAILIIAAAAAPVSLIVQHQEDKRHDEEAAAAMTGGGDPHAGRLAMKRYGCGACHSITGVSQADGQVGPSLDKIASRAFLAGRLPNQPDQMMRWIRTPQSVEPGAGMPDMGVTEKDARDIAAYLYTLR
jgi:cytochrome c2